MQNLQRKKGILRTGMLVDVVVLSDNLKTNSDRIKKAKAMVIICEGEIIFL